MDKQFSVCASLGRIHDPLLQLAERVHRAVLIREKTVWTDSKGHVFATPSELLQTAPKHTVVGVYAKWTSLAAIETGLRYALRERASAWIVDWKADYSLLTRAVHRRDIPQASAPRKRRHKVTVAEMPALLRRLGQSSHAQPPR